MIRLCVICEGHTEANFVKGFQNKTIYLGTSVHYIISHDIIFFNV